jgi:hypothetical protein
MNYVIGAAQGALIAGMYSGWNPYAMAAGAVAGVVVTAVGTALTSAPDIQAIGSPLQELQVTPNEIGIPVPDLLGTAKVTGNLLWYGGERSEAVTQEVGGGGKGGGSDSQTSITGYKYYMSWAIGICAGPVDEILTIFRNEDAVWGGNTVRPGSGGEETIVITDMGSVTFYFGTADQAANAALGALMDDPTLNTPYRGLCWAFFDDCYIGGYNRMPTMRFVLRKTPLKTFSGYGPEDPPEWTLDAVANEGILAIEDYDGKIYVGTRSGNIYVLNGSSLSLSYNSNSNAITCFCVYNGLLYAGSQYSSQIFVFDGSSWSTSFSGTGAYHVTDPDYPNLVLNHQWWSAIACLVVYEGSLWAGTDDAGKIYVLSEGSWKMSKITGSSNHLVDALAVYGDRLYAGTNYRFWVKNLSDWDWSVVSEGAWYHELCVYEDKLYAGISQSIQSYDGSSWSYCIYSQAIRGMAVFNGRLFAGENSNGIVREFDGVTWSSYQLEPEVSNSVRFTVLGNKLYAGTEMGGGIYSLDLYPLHAVQTLDYNPAYAIHYILHELTGLPETWLDEDDFEAMAETLYGEGRGISILMDSQQGALNYLESINSHVDAIVLYGSDGKFHPKLIRDDYAVGDLPLIDEGVVLDDPAFNRKSWIDTINEIKVQYSELSRLDGVACDIKQSTADPSAVDVGNKEIQGRIVSKTIQMALFTSNDNAVWAGEHNLRKSSYPFAVVSFPANRNAFRLEVGDCFKFSYARYGVSNMICRVLQISEEGPESENITVQATEDIFSVNNAITGYTASISHAITALDYTVVPLTHQKIIEAPYVISGEEIKLLPIACRESDPDLGFDVYMSINGGASYSFLQKITTFRPYGTLIGSYSGDIYTIDDDVGLTIDIEHGASLIETTTFDQVLAGLKNTALLGDEIISFQTITPVSGTQYKLEHVIRGRYDTVKESHAEGAEFYCFPSGGLQLIIASELITGAVRKFKFVPYNIKKSGAIADATAMTLTIAGRALTPYLPGNLQANGSSFAARYDDDILLTWTYSQRGAGAGIGNPLTVIAS